MKLERAKQVKYLWCGACFVHPIGLFLTEGIGKATSVRCNQLALLLATKLDQQECDHQLAEVQVVLFSAQCIYGSHSACGYIPKFATPSILLTWHSRLWLVTLIYSFMYYCSHCCFVLLICAPYCTYLGFAILVNRMQKLIVSYVPTLHHRSTGSRVVLKFARVACLHR